MPLSGEGLAVALDTLHTAHETTRRCGHGARLIGGAAGSGKTALMAAFRAQLPPDTLVIGGACVALPPYIPFGPVGDALTAWIASLHSETRQIWSIALQAAVGQGAAAVVSAVPALEALLGKQPVAAEVPPWQASLRLLGAMRRCFAALAQHQPCVVLMDNLQWADEGTLALFDGLAREPVRGSGLFVVGAWDGSTPVPSHHAAVLQLRAESARGAAPNSLSALQRDLCGTAACMGTTFSLDALCGVHPIDASTASQNIDFLIDQGIMTAAGTDFCFVHERRRRTAHEELDPGWRGARHAAWGRRLLQQANRPAAMAVVYHMGYARLSAADDSEEPRLVAALCLQAARDAHFAGAPDAALKLLRQGVALLPTGAWQKAYALLRDFTLLSIECNACLGNYQQAESDAQTHMDAMKTPLDRAEMHRRRLIAWQSQGCHQQACAAGAAALAALGVKIKLQPGPGKVMLELSRLTKVARGRVMVGLPNAPLVTNAEVLKLQQIIGEMQHSAYRYHGDLFAYLTLLAGRLLITHGTAPRSAATCATVAAVLAALAQHDEATAWAAAARAIMAKTRGPFDGRAACIVLLSVEHTLLAPPHLAAAYQQAAQLAAEDGDTTISGIAMVLAMQIVALQSLHRCSNDLLEQLVPNPNPNGYDDAAQCLYLLRALSEGLQNQGPAVLSAVLPPGSRRSSGELALRTMGLWLLNDYRGAIEAGEGAIAAGIFQGAASQPVLLFAYYLASAYLTQPPGTGRTRRFRQALRVLRGAPPSSVFVGLRELLEAEWAAGRQAARRAELLFERAVARLHGCGYGALEADAWERCGLFYARRGLRTLAARPLARAVELHERWGNLRGADKLRHAFGTELALEALPNALQEAGTLAQEVQNVLEPALQALSAVDLETLRAQSAVVGEALMTARRGLQRGMALTVTAMENTLSHVPRD